MDGRGCVEFRWRSSNTSGFYSGVKTGMGQETDRSAAASLQMLYRSVVVKKNS